jgi:hypothetical protein
MVHVSDDHGVDVFQGQLGIFQCPGHGFMDQFDAVHVQARAFVVRLPAADDGDSFAHRNPPSA